MSFLTKRLRKASLPTLPTELWMEILEWAIQPQFALDSHCRPSDIDEYSKAISNPLNGNLYKIEKKDRMRLGLVCKYWMDIIERGGVVDIWMQRGSYSYWSKSQEMKKITGGREFDRVQRMDYVFWNVGDFMKIEARLSVNVRVLHLMVSYGNEEQFVPMRRLMAAPSQLQVLHMDVSGMRTSVLMKLIESTFTGLVTLSLRLRSFDALIPFSLPFVKVLLLSTDMTALDGIKDWHFPLLDSFSITATDRSSWTTHESLLSFLEKHGKGLRGLRFSVPWSPKGPSYLDWTKLPNLECVSGLSNEGPELPSNIPKTHPLQRLVYIRPFTYSNPGKWCSHLNGRIPRTIKTLVLPIESTFVQRWTRYWEAALDNEIVQLEMFCKRHGIEILDEHGLEIKSLTKLFQVGGRNMKMLSSFMN